MAKVSHSSHPWGADAPARANANHTNIARDAGRGKATRAVEFHPGMTRKKTDFANLGGMGHATDANPGNNPMAKGSHGKSFAAAPAVVGHRSRHGEIGPAPVGAHHASGSSRGNSDGAAIGKQVIADALECADCNTRAAYLGRFDRGAV